MTLAHKTFYGKETDKLFTVWKKYFLLFLLNLLPDNFIWHQLIFMLKESVNEELKTSQKSSTKQDIQDIQDYWYNLCIAAFWIHGQLLSVVIKSIWYIILIFIGFLSLTLPNIIR